MAERTEAAGRLVSDPPTTFFLMVTTILNSRQAFDLLIAMDKLGRVARTLIFEAYLTGFKQQSQAGYSARSSRARRIRRSEIG